MAPSGERHEENASFISQSINLVRTLPWIRKASYQLWRVIRNGNHCRRFYRMAPG
jgi:hypothetical protein